MTQALTLQPYVNGYTPLSSTCADYLKTFVRNLTALATPEIIPNYKVVEIQKLVSERQQFLKEISSLLYWTDNWDGNGSAKPNASAILKAVHWGAKIHSIMIRQAYEWRKPFISADEEGSIVLEWWYQDRNLTLDISSKEIIFSETRDADSSPKITTGILKKAEIAPKLKWLVLGA